MGRAGSEPKPPRGVTIRELKDGPRLQIAFSYRGEQCRELLPAGKVTKSYMGTRPACAPKSDGRSPMARSAIAPTSRILRQRPGWSRARPQFLVPSCCWARCLTPSSRYTRSRPPTAASPASTLLGYAKAIKHYLRPRWSDTPVNELAPADLRAWIAGMGVTGKTVRNRLTPLRSVLDDAVNDELLDSNPLDRIALGKLIKQTATKEQLRGRPVRHG